MTEDADQRLAQIELSVAAMAEQMRRLNSSDRRQNLKIETQRRYTLIFFGVLGAGALLGFGNLNGESRQSLEQVAVAVIVAGAGGLIGVNSSHFKPPGEDLEDED